MEKMKNFGEFYWEMDGKKRYLNRKIPKTLPKFLQNPPIFYEKATKPS